jgi:antitoxin StbD
VKGVAVMVNEASIVSMMKAMIPITRFNRGEANKIFDEVEASGYKVVVKNNKPACVLVSPENYEALMEMLSDYRLLLEAQRRMEHFDRADVKTQDEVMRELGLTDADLDDVNVEIE